jgi:hypothetical protein
MYVDKYADEPLRGHGLMLVDFCIALSAQREMPVG